MLKKLPFILLFAAPIALGGTFAGCSVNTDDDDNSACDCDESHTSCVADCDDDDDSCSLNCDSVRDDCNRGCGKK